MSRLVVLVAAALFTAACGSEVASPQPAERVLIVSLPGVGWDDVERLDLETIRAFTETAAVGHVATRVGRRGADAASAYLTIGAGTRAVPPPEGAGAALHPGERYFGDEAEAVFARRVGKEMAGPGYIAVSAATQRNEASVYGANPGTLGDLLVAGGVATAVFANADETKSPEDGSALHREAVAALMTSDGRVADGVVGRELLQERQAAPFGLTLDTVAVEEAFAGAWSRRGRTVVLVEASDLRRARSYGEVSAPGVAREMRDDALRGADQLLGRLLDHVEESDAVLVLSPVAPPSGNQLGLVALRAPGVDGGMLSSATTRRTGYVQLADVAPTVATLTGLEAPERIEGRSFTFVPVDSADARIPHLARDADKAQFRDQKLPVVVLTLVGILALLLAGALVLRRFPASATPARLSALRLVSYGVLGAVPATYVAHLVGDGLLSIGTYAGFVAAVAVAVAAVCALVERTWPELGLVLAVALVVGVIAVDVMFGAPLQLNAVFGYSVAVAGRFAGVGNLAFALLSAGAVLLAVLLADRFGRRGRVVAFGLLAAVVLVDGMPMFGADVGGVLSMVPAFGVTALVLAGRRVGLRESVMLVGAAVGVLLVAAFVDVARPAGSRTHLARLAEHVVDRRWDRLFDSLVRRWAASFGAGELGAWVLLALVVVVTAVYVLSTTVRARRDWWPRATATARSWRAACAGIALLALLGLVANDSSFAVPATMLIVIVPVAVERTLVHRTREALS